jgi:hypothetical protein
LLAAAALELEPAESGDALRRFGLAACVASLLLATGLRFYQVRAFIDGQLAQVPRARAQGKLEVVFLRMDRGYYTVDLVQNDPFLDGARWILLSFGRAEDERFMRRFFPAARMAGLSNIGSVWEID